MAYPQKTRNKPAKRRALDARFPAARPPFKRDLYCAGENREKRAASRVSLSQSRVYHLRPQTGPKTCDMTLYLLIMQWNTWRASLMGRWWIELNKSANW